MTRVLKASGFFGLAVMMVVGLYQGSLFAMGQTPPFWLVAGHAHLGVLSILAIVTGFAVESLAITGRLRRVVTGLFLVGQWGLPVTWWVAFGTGTEILLATFFVWGSCLIISMLLMTWQVVATGTADREQSREMPADD